MEKRWQTKISHLTSDNSRLDTLTIELRLESRATALDQRITATEVPFAQLRAVARSIKWCEELDRAIEGMVKDFFKT